MKRIILVTFFATYHLFAPFALVSCGEDTPYDVRTDSGAGEGDAGATQDGTDCDENRFLTKDCVAEALSEAEQEGSRDGGSGSDTSGGDTGASGGSGGDSSEGGDEDSGDETDTDGDDGDGAGA